jgi:superfamily II DNA helicase RecQ
LIINIKSKSISGIHGDFADLIEMWKKKADSTIIYCPTKAVCEKVVTYLQNVLGKELVTTYHGDMEKENRNAAHLGFLSGQYTVIVATVAFGMGIDKPDIRRIIHYGTPKTMEEYYQHIGRGGRDGLESYCNMFYSTTDFVRYKSSFYTQNLSAKALEMANRSGDYLRNFVEDSFTCRRFQILKYFNEAPAFGNKCGNCDNCVKQLTGSSSQCTTRDFTNHANVIFTAINTFGGQAISMTKIIKEIKELFRNTADLCNNFEDGERSENVFKALLPGLVRSQYILRTIKTNPPYSSYEVYSLTPEGRRRLLKNNTETIMQPVPDILVEIEKKNKERISQIKNNLVSKGIDLSVIPLGELQAGKGPIINVYTSWINRLESLRRRGKDDVAQKYEELLKRIEEWRTLTSKQFGVAPHNVISGCVMRQIAYVQPTSVEALESIGVRIRTVNELASIMTKSVKELFNANSSLPSSSNNDLPMVFPENKKFKPKKPWLFAKEGRGHYRSSLERFQNGEMLEAIAMRRENGKSIQVFTVVTHVLTGLVLGEPINLKRLASPTVGVTPPPTEEEWTKIEIASRNAGIDVIGTEKFQMKDLMPFIVGEENAAVDYKDRSESLQQVMSTWYKKVRWWMCLRRAGFVPQFGVWKD